MVRATAHPGALSSDHVYEAFAAVAVEEIALARGRARVLTGPTCEHSARTIARRLGGDTLVLPVLDEPLDDALEAPIAASG